MNMNMNMNTTPTTPTSAPGIVAPSLSSSFDPRKATREQVMAFLEQAKAMGIDPSRLNPSAKYILSVVPWDLTSPTFHHGGGLQHYFIPAAELDSYQVLPVYDSVTFILDSTRTEEEIASDGHSYTPRPVYAQSIVDNLLQYWAGDHIANKAGHRIGLIQIANSKPTEEELSRCRKQHVDCCRWMVEAADSHYVRGHREKILNEHRRALQFLRAEDPKLHPWYVEIGRTTGDIPGGCPACSSPVPATAYVCPTCRLNIAEHFHKRGKAADPKTMPGIHEELAYLRQTSPTVQDKIAEGRAKIAETVSTVSTMSKGLTKP